MPDGLASDEARAPVAIFTIGTQGDIRPCVALGLGLQRAGHPVRIVTSANFADLVRGAGLEFFPLTADFRALMESEMATVERGLDPLAVARTVRRRMREWARSWVAEGLPACAGAGLVIGVGNVTLLAKSLAEARGIAFVQVQLQPLTPSRLLAPMVFVPRGRALPGVVNLGIYQILRLLVWQIMRPSINGVVRPQLGLHGYPWYGPYFNAKARRGPVIYGISEEILPRPPDWPPSVQMAGYWFLDEPGWRAPDALQRFLAAGPTPIYVGFGSMMNRNAGEFTRTVLEGLRLSGRRAVLAIGWGGLDAADGVGDENLFFLGHAPHDWLFPRMSLAVHHGGAGTTAAAARAGIPSIVVPFYGDQPFWARCLQRQGVAPRALDRKTLTAAGFSAAIAEALQPSMQRAAEELGRRIRAEDGVRNAVRLLQEWKLLATSDLAPSP